MKKVFNESDWPECPPITLPEEPDFGVPDVDLRLSPRWAA